MPVAPAKSAKRGSSSSSGCSTASHSRSQNFCFAHATVIHPSEAANAWKGTIEGWADSGRRCGFQPLVPTQVPTYMSCASAVSNREMSQSQPTPSRRARHRPATSASADT